MREIRRLQRQRGQATKRAGAPRRKLSQPYLSLAAVRSESISYCKVPSPDTVMPPGLERAKKGGAARDYSLPLPGRLPGSVPATLLLHTWPTTGNNHRHAYTMARVRMLWKLSPREWAADLCYIGCWNRCSACSTGPYDSVRPSYSGTLPLTRRRRGAVSYFTYQERR